MKLIIHDKVDWHDGALAAKVVARDYPDQKPDLRNGIVLSLGGKLYYVYKTKTAYVVRKV